MVIQGRYGSSVVTGSGFLVSKEGLIATTYRVIEDAVTAHVVLANNTKLSVLGVAASDQAANLAVIKVDGQVRAEPLELAGDDLPPIGAKVYAIGDPLGAGDAVSEGKVTRHRETNGITVLETTAPINPKSNGGPLLGTDGTVVGVMALGFEEGHNLNLGIPSSAIAKLLLRWKGQGQLTRLPLGWFKPETFEKTYQVAAEIKRRYGKDLIIETYETLPEKRIEEVSRLDKDGKSRFFSEWAHEPVHCQKSQRSVRAGVQVTQVRPSRGRQSDS